MKWNSENTFPYRIDLYRPDQVGTLKDKRPLIVVHGYSAEIYPMQWLMHLLADQLPKYAIYQYSFETYQNISNKGSLEEASRILGSELLRVKHEHELADGVLFVGHSTGGLIARRCFIDYQSQLGKGTFVFLGTPHYGAEIAGFKNIYTLAHREKQTRELRVGSDFIWRLNRDWVLMKEDVIEKTLSIVGTYSDKGYLGRLPKKGMWVQSDGVVRATSASLLPRSHETGLVMHVPLDHSALKDIAPEWRKLSSLRKDDLVSPPVPTRDLPFIAAIIFLKDLAKWNCPEDHYDTMWELCIDYLEDLERAYRSTLFMQLEHHKDDGGNWVRKSDEELAMLKMDINSVKFGFPRPKGYLSLPSGPTFVENLLAYQAGVCSFWNADCCFGSALIRLDYLDIPPRPRLEDIVDSDEVSRLKEVKANPAHAIRVGARWITLYIPELSPGVYRLVFMHSKVKYEASIEIYQHYTALYEINGFTGSTKNLSKPGYRAVHEASRSYERLEL